MTCSVHQFAGPQAVEDGTKDLCAVCHTPRYTPSFDYEEAREMIAVGDSIARRIGAELHDYDEVGDYPVRIEYADGPTLYLELTLAQAKKLLP